MRRVSSGRSWATCMCVLLSVAAIQADQSTPARAQAGTLAARRSYRIDHDRSRITVETRSTGLLSYSAHRHLLSAREFRGQVSLVPGMLETTVVDFSVRADSLTILDDMSEPSRRDIDLAIRRTLEADRFPRIVFHSSYARADLVGPDIYEVAASGTLDLHGVRRALTVSGQLAVDGGTVHIHGTCTLRQTDYGLVPFSTGKGTLNVADDVTLTFDLVATAPATSP